MQNYIETLPFWKDLTIEQQELLQAYTIERSFHKGEILDHGNQECTGLEMLVNGQARMEAVPLKKSYGEGGLNLHAKNHLECIKSRNRNCNASVEIGAHIAKFSQLGNIAYCTGKKLSWDGKSFHDTEADKLLCKEYRAPWELPNI